jgi:hypothetical protein
MWGFGIYLMRLADYLKGRKDRRQRLQDTKVCRVCGRNFSDEEELDKHTRKEHPNMV